MFRFDVDYLFESDNIAIDISVPWKVDSVMDLGSLVYWTHFITSQIGKWSKLIYQYASTSFNGNYTNPATN